MSGVVNLFTSSGGEPDNVTAGALEGAEGDALDAEDAEGEALDAEDDEGEALDAEDAEGEALDAEYALDAEDAFDPEDALDAEDVRESALDALGSEEAKRSEARRRSIFVTPSATERVRALFLSAPFFSAVCTALSKTRLNSIATTLGITC